MNRNQLLIKLRTKKLGILMYDARLASKRSIKECAEAISISRYQYKAFESGEQAPSLPELEAFAYYLNIPLEHFWENEALSDDSEAEKLEEIDSLVEDRVQEISAFIFEKRSAADISLEELAEKSTIELDQLEDYQLGKDPIPTPELEIIAQILDIPLSELFDRCGTSGSQRAQQNKIQNFLSLPDDMQEFICKPVNHPYLELALRLSGLSSDKLRSIAESLLEITY